MKEKETLTEAIKHLGDLDERPAELREAIFNRLFEQAEIAKYTPVERQAYEESLKNFRDWYSCLITAVRKGRAEGREEGRDEGREEGRAEGRKEGRAEGRKEGRAEGRKEGRLSIARNLKASGALTISQIAMATNLTEDEAEKA